MIDFPTSPTLGQVFNSGVGPIYTWDGVAWNLSPTQTKTADKNNLIDNPSMWVSQENGNTTVTANGTWPVDQLALGLATSGAVSAQQVATPAGSKSPSPYRVRLSVTTADTSLAAGEYAYLTTKIEGLRCGALKWGSADAKQLVLRFGFKGPAGTYTVSFRNSAADRSYLATFTITTGQANTETEQVLVIPGDVTGTWTIDNTAGLMIGFCFASGATFTGVAGWQAGNLLSAAGATNGLASTSNVFELFDVGLYVDPDKTNLPPPYEVPDYDVTLERCSRYYFTINGCLIFSSYAGAGGQVINTLQYKPMRTTPTVGYTGVSYANASAIATNAVTDRFIRPQVSATAVGQAYGGCNIILNARM
jgi:hypothetical protein